ncbi:MAG: hypothetical protein K9L74_07515 [Candidatus Izimaplasma sp.]|nr:hypothetical protein [Candidatus Izimaplasma bacterium]
MKRRVSIIIEIVLLVLFTFSYFLNGDLELGLRWLGMLIVGTTILTLISVFTRRKFKGGRTYFYPQIILNMIALPVLLVLTFTSDGWGGLIYGMLLVIILMVSALSMPFYYIIEDKMPK